MQQTRTITLGLLLFSLLQSNFAYQCSSTCGTPDDLAFCTNVNFAVCGGDSTWDDIDLQAKNSYLSWSNYENTPLKQLPLFRDQSNAQLNASIMALELNNPFSSCSKVIKRLECAMKFPVCEIGSDYIRPCVKSCRNEMKKNCPSLSQYCDMLVPDELELNGSCFRLDYKGPSVVLWVVGFTISLVFSILNSIGINLQKLSMTRNEASDTKKGTCHQPLWICGFALVTVGSILDFVAFGMAPQTLLAPLAALSLVWNMFIAPVFHNERVTRQNLVATAIIFAGVTLTVIFSAHSTPSYTIDDLVILYQQKTFFAYVILIGSFLTGLFLLCRYIERTHIYEGGIQHIICYGGIAGTFGGQTVLLAKSTVELLKSWIWGDDGSEMFLHIASYLIVLGLATCLYFQVHFLNGGLARFDALVVIPVYQSFWILMSVLGGIMYFQEYVNMTRIQIIMFTVGGSITILGIVVLLRSRPVTSSIRDPQRYVELVVTSPRNVVWIADDSDEENIELKITPETEVTDVDDSPLSVVLGGNLESSDSAISSVSTPKTSNIQYMRHDSPKNEYTKYSSEFKEVQLSPPKSNGIKSDPKHRRL